MILYVEIVRIQEEQEGEQENGDEERDSWVYRSSFVHVPAKRRLSESGPWPRLVRG